MSEGFEGFSNKYRESLISAISVGFFFLLVGAIFIATPNLLERIIGFFRGFDIVRVPNSGIWLPAPVSPSAHRVVYSAVAQFSYVWGIFQLVILVLRFAARSPWNKKAETVSNLVFWLGAGYLTSIFLIETTRWFPFWATIIMLIGVSLIIRAIILAAVPARHVI